MKRSGLRDLEIRDMPVEFQTLSHFLVLWAVEYPVHDVACEGFTAERTGRAEGVANWCL